MTEAAVRRAESRRASWLELFYDLLFVALVAELAHGLVLGTPALAAIGLFVPAWWVWVSYTVFANVADVDSAAHRVAVLANMAGLLVMAAGVGQALHGHPELFALGYAASRLCRSLAAVDAMRRSAGRWPPVKTLARTQVPYLLSAVLWAASAAVSPPWCYSLWAVALILEILPGLSRAAARMLGGERLAVDPGHIVERFGLFAIIALGEGVALTVVAMAGRQGDDGISGAVILDGLAAFALLAVMWWLYFDFASATAEKTLRDEPGRAHRIVIQGFVIGHFVVVAGILAIAAGLSQIVAADTAHASPVLGVRLVCVGLACYLTNNAILGLRLLGVPISRTLTWYVPMAATLITGWFLAAYAPAPVVLFLVAAALAVSSAFSSRRSASGHRR